MKTKCRPLPKEIIGLLMSRLDDLQTEVAAIENTLSDAVIMLPPIERPRKIIKAKKARRKAQPIARHAMHPRLTLAPARKVRAKLKRGPMSAEHKAAMLRGKAEAKARREREAIAQTEQSQPVEAATA